MSVIFEHYFEEIHFINYTINLFLTVFFLQIDKIRVKLKYR
ncbi:hypothetical protein NCDO763_2384 [Lactococcus cremoris]|uniref:Uncharacterized protein n=1 Tax=Lactococcus lactis subsp. cremoris (strain MG1363) TaxID=416870 RepID=A2RMQ6_LACLM|nr:hypothetical protein N41_0810 [Lactococcus cremoris]KZK49022.1 hypothetical protein NCDO763_2384 [Lactococcus cremoris]CAL98590.1 hypothetical protein predicted by Glimmer/Critica [Lactococcus cremoris subsp. cremoris MG1363]